VTNRPRSRTGRVLLWILLIVLVLIVLSLLFGGFQKGTKAAPAAPPAVIAATTGPLLVGAAALEIAGLAKT
jgi:hypothetical protein